MFCSESPELYEEKLEQLKEQMRPKPQVKESIPESSTMDTGNMKPRTASGKPKVYTLLLSSAAAS